MKIIILGSALALGLVAATANACPNLSGNWSCSESGATFTQIISQSTNGNVVTYQFTTTNGTSYQLIADGQPHPLPPASRGDVTGSYTVTCDSDTELALSETMTSSSEAMTATMNGSVILQSPTNYVVSAQEVITQDGQPPQNSTATENCTLQQ